MANIKSKSNTLLKSSCFRLRNNDETRIVKQLEAFLDVFKAIKQKRKRISAKATQLLSTKSSKRCFPPNKGA